MSDIGKMAALVVVGVLLGGGAVAWWGAPRPAAQTPAAETVESLLKQWDYWDDRCRGGSGDSDTTWVACHTRDEVVSLKIEAAGWCYGEGAEFGYQMKWAKCGAGRGDQASSAAGLAAAEAAAAADDAASATDTASTPSASSSAANAEDWYLAAPTSKECVPLQSTFEVKTPEALIQLFAEHGGELRRFNRNQASAFVLLRVGSEGPIMAVAPSYDTCIHGLKMLEAQGLL